MSDLFVAQIFQMPNKILLNLYSWEECLKGTTATALVYFAKVSVVVAYCCLTSLLGLCGTTAMWTFNHCPRLTFYNHYTIASGKSQGVKLHKFYAKILCTLPIDKNSARHNRRRAAKNKKRALALYFPIQICLKHFHYFIFQYMIL